MGMPTISGIGSALTSTKVFMINFVDRILEYLIGTTWNHLNGLQKHAMEHRCHE